MAHINESYLELSGSYLFAHINRRVAAFRSVHPDADIIRLGIGDVTRPLVPAVIQAMHAAVEEMASAATFRGYGPEQGYEFLQEAILDGDYRPRNVKLDADEIFISDGSKCDVANIQEIFGADVKIAIADPVYPVYLDSNIMAGRSRNIVFLPGSAGNDFLPQIPEEKVDLIYLCSPNNPTGSVLDRAALTRWVEYARENRAIILFDSAYSAYIRDETLPRSIYEIPGAREVAIEFKSFSKSASFTGVRCAYTIIPKELNGFDGNGNPHSLHTLWNRRQTTKFNGTSYIVQRAAEAACRGEGRLQNQAVVDYYMGNADIIRTGLERAGHTVYGGKNAPYIWWKLPSGLDSMKFFDTLLEKCRVVGTPGVGFGSCGEGYFRLTAFGDRERTREAVERIVAAGW